MQNYLQQLWVDAFILGAGIGGKNITINLWKQIMHL